MKSLFEISKSGLRSAEHALSVTSNNVINADTPGYTRRRVEQSPVGMQMSRFHTGLGVNVTNINRLRNEMNDVQLNEKRQDMGFMQEKGKILEQLEASMASDSGGDLDLRIGKMFDLFSELSSEPQDYSVRNSIVSEAEQFSDKMGDMSRSLDRTSELVKDSGIESVENINHLLDDLAALNSSIKQAEAMGKPDHTSLDLQVEKLEELSEMIDFDSQKSANGSLEIRIGGIKVLNEDEVTHLKSEINDVDKNFRLRLDNGKVIEASGGKLGAEINMYENDIPETKARLDQIAATMVEEFNAIHSDGYGLDGGTNRNFFNPTGTTALNIEIDQNIKDNVDYIAASSENGESGNGDQASAIADLRNQNIIEGRKLVDYSVDLISTPGRKLTEVNSKMEALDSEIQMLNTQQEQEAGVNIDEELSLMIQYQNAYQGAARVMSSAQEMYDTLINLTR